jgi:hypothetical protein
MNGQWSGAFERIDTPVFIVRRPHYKLCPFVHTERGEARQTVEFSGIDRNGANGVHCTTPTP